MARKKVTLQRITNDSVRRGTFKKRRMGLMKKASELATLCDVDTCIVVYGEGESRPEVWPADAAEAERVLARFKDVPELDQCKKMMDMEGLLRQRNDKIREQLLKAQRDNRERETAILLHDAIVGRRSGLVGLSAEDIASLGWMVENRLRVVREAIERRQLHGKGQGQHVDVAAATTLQLHLPQPSSLPSAGAGHWDVMQVMPHPQGWQMTGGDLGALVYNGFGGAGAGGDMLPQSSNMGVRFEGPDPAGQSFPSM
ncbi:hypothetical protein U9M48_023225 [Paspalum notatum var. saurae]|uniref:MADS-box domain-containing protein n=1 Tax=Paspalum notatum var. saurae TaxID=547442 RepID=A0AAQ3TL56_PASNO